MTEYTIYTFELFLSVFDSLDTSEKLWIYKIKENLQNGPSGKVLHYPWFRKKKYLNKRLYFLIDEETKRILFVHYGSKKNQQKIINYVLANKECLFEILREANSTF